MILIFVQAKAKKLALSELSRVFLTKRWTKSISNYPLV